MADLNYPSRETIQELAEKKDRSETTLAARTILASKPSKAKGKRPAKSPPNCSKPQQG